MTKMFFSLSLIIAGIGLGYLVQQLSGKKRESSIAGLRKSLQKIAITWIIPLTVITSLWVAPVKHGEIALLPLLGVTALSLGGLLALALARPLKLDGEHRGIFFIGGSFTNIGSLGGLISFLLLGEQGFALVAFYNLLEKFFYFGIGFPFAKARSSHREDSDKQNVLSLFMDPIVLVNLAAIIIGLTLNFLDVPRPDIFETINAVLVPLSSFCLLFSIGLAMRFSQVIGYWKPGVTIMIIKSLILPLIMSGIVLLFGLHHFQNGLVWKLVLILSAMPMGFTAMVPPSIYDMDLDMANSCWLLSNLTLLYLIPLLFWVIPKL